MKKVFIFGYYGFKNLGDEAILTSIIKTIKELDSSVMISALTYNEKYTSKIHGIKGVSRNRLAEVLRAIKAADLVISGGGSLLQDITSSRSLIYYLILILISKFMKKPVMFYSNGFGPIQNRFNKILTRKVVNLVDKIIVRDEDSRKVMEAIGIRNAIEITTDATFGLEGIHAGKAKELLMIENIPLDRPLVGISIRPWYFKDSFLEIMAKFSDYLADKGISVVFIPMQTPKDYDTSNKILKLMKKEAYVLKGEYDPEELLGIIGEMKFLVGMRLHALIFAGIMGVPMLGLEYDPKIPAFLNTISQKNMGPVEKLDNVSLCIEFDKLWKEREELSNRLTSSVQLLKQKALKNKEILKAMLD